MEVIICLKVLNFLLLQFQFMIVKNLNKKSLITHFPFSIFITVLHFVKVISQDEKFIEQFGGVNMSDSIVFNKIKCTVTVRVLDFITILCKDGKNSMTFVPENLFCEDLWVLLSMRLLQPSFLGFDIKNVEEKICFPSRMLELLEAMRDGLPKQHITSVYSVMQKKLESCLSLLFTDLPLKLQADHFSQQDKHIVDGLCILLNSKFLGSIEKVNTSHNNIIKFCSNIINFLILFKVNSVYIYI